MVRHCRHLSDASGAISKSLTSNSQMTSYCTVRVTNSGVWERVFHELVRDRKNQYLMLDSTIVRAHQQAGTGRKKGARTRLWGVPEEV